LRWLHELFLATLLIKGSLAGANALAGLGLAMTANDAILSLVGWPTRNRIAQGPGDSMARRVERAVRAFPIQARHFHTFCLLAHGGLMLAMVILLARHVIWAHPAAVALLLGFTACQLQHLSLAPSPPLLILSALGAIIIALVIRECKALRLPPHIA
jgi:uncharacterized membrane protein